MRFLNSAFLLLLFSYSSFVFAEELSTDELSDIQIIAETGDTGFQWMLGLIYQKGLGITKDYKQAFYWYSKAGEQGDLAAQYNLGKMYHDGEGIKQNYKQAFYWYSKAGEQGDLAAQYNLGVLYANGQGITQNYVRALIWWNIASSSGDDDAIWSRDDIEKRMTQEEITFAQKFAREWMEAHE